MEEAVPVPPPVVAEAVAAEESTSAATSSSSSLPSGEGGEESGGEAPTNFKKGRRRSRSAILSLASDEGLSRISFGMSQRSSKSTPTFSCSLDARCERSKRKVARGASPPSRSCNSFCCFLVKNNRRDDATKTPCKPNVPLAQADGDDGAVDRTQTPVFGECLPCATKKREGDDC